MEEAIRKSEEKFRNIFESANDCMIFLDQSGRILDVNGKAVEVFGGSKKELLGKHFAKAGVFSPKDLPTLLSVFAKVLAGKQPTLDIHIKNKKGQEILLECSASLMKMDDKFAGLLVIARDVTARKKAEEELEKSEMRYRSLVEDTGAGIAIADSEGKFTFVNKALCKMIGYSEKELIGKPFVDFLHPDDKERILQIFWESWRYPNRRLSLDFRVIHKKGHIVHMYSSPTLLRYKNEIVEFNAIIHDITERKKAEEELANAHARLEHLVTASPTVIYASEFRDRWVNTFVSENVKDVLGYEPREFLEDPDFWIEHIHPEDRLNLHNVPSHIIKKGRHTHEYRVLHKDGTYRWMHNEIKIEHGPEGKPFSCIGYWIDITERKVAEDALRKSESKYRTLLENVPQKIFFKDKNSVYISCNGNYAQDLKIESNEIAGKTDYDFYPKELAEKYRVDDQRIMKSGKTEDIEEEYIQDGHKVFVHTVKTPVKDENGNVVGILGIFWDITERKQMEEALKRQRDIAITFSGARELTDVLNRLFDNLLEIEEFDCAGFYLVDKDTGAVDMIAHRDLPDRFVEKVSHLDADSPYTKVVMEGKPIYQKTSDFPPTIREDLQSDGILAVAVIPIQYEGEVIGNLNMASHTHDKVSASTRHVLESVAAQIGETIDQARMGEKLRESEEKLRQYSEHLEELVQKRTKELIESEKRYSVLVEEASDGVAILQDEKVVFTNKKAPDFLGYSRDEIIGLPFEKLLDEKYRQLAMERYVRRLRGEKIPATYEIELIAKTGERIPVELSATLIHYQGRSADLIIIRDIRERKRLEEERLKLEKLATIGELATMVGHDLRNPLQAITNAVYVLKNTTMTMNSTIMSEQYEKVSNLLPEPILNEILQHFTNFLEDYNKMIYTIDESVKYADKIVSDLQDFARTKEPELVEVDLESLIQETLSDISIPENIKVSIIRSQRLPKLYIDPNQIRRVFTNLTTNAIEAMPNGGKLTISSSTKSGFATIAFQDTGVCIPKENMKKLFIPLFTTKAKGMGMGLPICKKFVEMHSGTIEAESEEGKGTTFTVKLPIQQENRGEKP